MEQELLREHCQAYLLGALENDENNQIQSLINQRDPACLAALQEARELVAQIGFAAPLMTPPSSLRGRVLSAIAAEPRKVVSIGRARSGPNYPAWAAWAVAAALLVAVFVFRSDSSRLGSDLARVRAEYSDLQRQFGTLSTEAAFVRRVLAIVAARGSRAVRLASTAPEAPQFSAYWAGSEGLVLLGSNVPAPAPGRALQLWVLPKTGQPIPAGVFRPDESGRVVMVADTTASVDVANGLAISDEPAGGSPQPTTTPGWIGKLSD
jgi:anti-sigma-K factor RskA